jgi:hypothetical protein
MCAVCQQKSDSLDVSMRLALECVQAVRLVDARPDLQIEDEIQTVTELLEDLAGMKQDLDFKAVSHPFPCGVRCVMYKSSVQAIEAKLRKYSAEFQRLLLIQAPAV